METLSPFSLILWWGGGREMHINFTTAIFFIKVMVNKEFIFKTMVVAYY